VLIWYIFSRFGMLDQEKSGNPALLLFQLKSMQESDLSGSYRMSGLPVDYDPEDATATEPGKNKGNRPVASFCSKRSTPGVKLAPRGEHSLEE
jgi:hypothetical protein